MSLLRNSIVTPDGTILESKSTYDFVEYTDNNGQYYAVDGGLSYNRRVCDKVDYIETSLYESDNIRKLREELTWESYNAEELKIVKIKDLTTNHIVDIIRSQYKSKYIKVLIRELEFRQQHNFVIREYNVRARDYVEEFYFINRNFTAHSKEQAISKAFKYFKLKDYNSYIKFKRDMVCKPL